MTYSISGVDWLTILAELSSVAVADGRQEFSSKTLNWAVIGRFPS
jgi:hypothetical protein